MPNPPTSPNAAPPPPPPRSPTTLRAAPEDDGDTKDGLRQQQRQQPHQTYQSRRRAQEERKLSSSSSSSSSSSRARLLDDLPAELRQLILTEALHDAEGIRISSEGEPQSNGQCLRTLAALRRVSHQMRGEADGVFAACNRFAVDNAGGLLFLLERLSGVVGVRGLRRVDVAFARPTGRGFVEDPDALRKVLAMLEEEDEEEQKEKGEGGSPRRLRLTVELSLRAVQAPWNHAHERENEPCYHYPESAKNKAGKNFWIHPASVRDTPHADDIRRLVACAAAVLWSGSPQYSWSATAGNDSLDFVRKSEEWLRPERKQGFEFVCSWEEVPLLTAPLSDAKWKDYRGVVRPVAEAREV